MIPFYDCSSSSGIDNAIRHGMEIFPEEEKLMFSYPFIRPGDIVYDVGGYVGTHSVLFTLAGAQVYSFEPSPYNFPRCVRNCAPFKQIKIFNVAFHEKEYDVTTRFKDCNNPTADNNDKEQFIRYKILPKFIQDNNLPIPDFIKLDIEGMETLVFKTLEPLINEKTIIYTERHLKKDNETGTGNYKDNPNWLFPEEGGYDFNELKKYHTHELYNLTNKCVLKKLINEDINQIDQSLVIIPKNRIKEVVENTKLKVE